MLMFAAGSADSPLTTRPHHHVSTSNTRPPSRKRNIHVAPAAQTVMNILPDYTLRSILG
jgi:hypothetical protein